jgi:hypothetical protein
MGQIIIENVCFGSLFAVASPSLSIAFLQRRFSSSPGRRQSSATLYTRSQGIIIAIGRVQVDGVDLKIKFILLRSEATHRSNVQCVNDIGETDFVV